MKIENYVYFNTVLDLIKELEGESKKKRGGRFPSRFIIVNDLYTWNDLIDKLKNFVDEIIYLSSYCYREDTFPIIKRAIEDSKNFARENKKVLLLPISEVIRVDPKAENRLFELIEVQLAPGFGRIYVPLFDLTSQFIKAWESCSDSIRRNSPYIVRNSLDVGKHVNVWLINDRNYVSEDIKDITILEGFRDYLRFWENQINQPDIILYSQCLCSLLDTPITGNVNIIPLKTPKDFIANVLKVNIPIVYSERDYEYWIKLIRELSKSKQKDWEAYLREKFNVMQFSEDLFYKWNELNNFEKWLLYNWAKIKISADCYLFHVLRATEHFLDLEKKIWLAVFDILDKLSLEHIKERRDLIEKLEIPAPPEFFQKVDSFKDPVLKLKVLSGVTFDEKYRIIKCIGDYLREGKQISEVLDLLEIIYPELRFYLAVPNFRDEFLNKYIKEYIFAKLRDEFTQKLEDLARQFAEQDMLWIYPTRNQILENYDDCLQIWIDALGLEWVGFIKSLLERKFAGIFDISFSIGRANLPTVSEHNRPVSKDVKIFYNLDKILHSYDYEYPRSIIEEFDCLKKILDELVTILISEKCVVITSDHGATRFSGWSKERIELPRQMEQGKIEREGRYMIMDVEPQERSDYFTVKHENKWYLISKTHKVFRDGKKPRGETHGGATLEEAVVPIIIIKRLKRIPVEVRLLRSKVPAFKPILRVKISQKLKDVYMRVLDEFIKGIQIDDFTWEFDLSELKLKPGKYTATIEAESIKKEIEFTIESGMEEEEII